MWYLQRTGELYAADGELMGRGYAGLAEHKNRPESDHLRNFGPLPRGSYRIGPPHSTIGKGPYVLRLTPDPANVMHGRAGFLIHGDSISAPGTASNGCIILSRLLRVRVWESGDRTLRVRADHEELP